MKKRILSIALCLCMVLTLLPTVAMAATTTEVDNLNTFTSSCNNAAEGGTVQLTDSITLSSDVTITNANNFTIDLNGETITCGTYLFNLTGAGKVTIVDGNTGGKITGANTDTNSVVIEVAQTGSLAVEDATITATGTGTNAISNYGSLIVSGGTVSSVSGYAISNYGSLIVSGGKVERTNGTAIYNWRKACKTTVGGVNCAISGSFAINNTVKSEITVAGPVVVQGQTNAITGSVVPTVDEGFTNYVVYGDATNYDGSAKAKVSLTTDNLNTFKYLEYKEKADGPAAPSNLVGVKPTTLGGSDGKITGTTAEMEYSTSTEFASATACTATETTGLSANTYYVRVKATDTTKAGAYATVEVPAGDAATVTAISVNSTTHKTAYKVGETLDVANLTISATMSYGVPQNVSVTSDMVSGFNSAAVATSQTLTITYEGQTTTYTISIGKADGPAAPNNLVGVKPTTLGGSDGKITGTTDAMEYSTAISFASATACTATETTDLTAGTYYVRLKETATHNAGEYATVTVPAGDAATVTAISVNSTTHKTAYKVGDALDVANLTILVDMSYGTDSTENVTAGMVTGFDSSAVAESQTPTITYEGKTATYIISIAKADGPAAPVGLVGVKPATQGGNDGKITGTTDAMEYSTSTEFASATACTGTETIGLTADTYYVRVKATTTHNAGEYATVTVPAGDAATVTAISVNSTTHKTVYKVGETLDVADLTVSATMSYGTAQTVNVTTAMVSGFNSVAVAASQALTITYEGQTATYNISIAKADTAAPSAPTLSTKTHNSITVAPNSLHEFRLGTDGVWQTSNVFSGLTPSTEYTIYARVAETTTNAASPASATGLPVTTDTAPVKALTGTVTVTGTEKFGSELTAEVTASNNTGMLTYQWKRDGSNNIGSNSANYTLTAEDINHTITCEVTSSVETGAISSSATGTIAKADGPAVTGVTKTNCTTSANNNGKLTGVTDLLEYQKSGDQSWTDGTGNEITGLANGTYYVRVKATTTHNAGAQSAFVIAAYSAPSSSDNGGGGGSATPSYSVTNNTTKTENGSVSLSSTNATSGSTVKITPKADDGYEVDILTVKDASGKAITVTKNADGTYSFKMPASKVTVEATFKEIVTEAPWVNPFHDVSEKDWYYDGVAYAAENGLFNGTGADTFSPKADMTRQQMWMVLARVNGKAPANMAEAAKWATDNGVSDGSNPTNAVTREQFVTLLWRSAGSPAASKDMSGYTDFGSVAGYAKESMRWAVENGIMAGTSATTLSPENTATRAQIAVLLMRYLSM